MALGRGGVALNLVVLLCLHHVLSSHRRGAAAARTRLTVSGRAKQSGCMYVWHGGEVSGEQDAEQTCLQQHSQFSKHWLTVSSSYVMSAKR